MVSSLLVFTLGVSILLFSLIAASCIVVIVAASPTERTSTSTSPLGTCADCSAQYLADTSSIPDRHQAPRPNIDYSYLILIPIIVIASLEFTLVTDFHLRYPRPISRQPPTSNSNPGPSRRSSHSAISSHPPLSTSDDDPSRALAGLHNFTQTAPAPTLPHANPPDPTFTVKQSALHSQPRSALCKGGSTFHRPARSLLRNRARLENKGAAPAKAGPQRPRSHPEPPQPRIRRIQDVEEKRPAASLAVNHRPQRTRRDSCSSFSLKSIVADLLPRR